MDSFQAYLQAFHLSKRNGKVTHVWADDASQQYHDSFSSKHADAGAAASEHNAGQDDKIPSRHSAQQISKAFAQKAPPAEKKPEETAAQKPSRLKSFKARQQNRASTEQESKAVQVQSSIDGFDNESMQRMLAVHARTQRRAQSLVDKVRELRTDCTALLDAMPQEILAEL